MKDDRGELDLTSLAEQHAKEIWALKAKINELEGTLGSAQDINDNHQRYNGKLQTRVTELERDNKKLSKQIDDQLDRFRRSGL
jgi:predicted  nucleic acid-binding Zn-ribbon protein